MGPIFNKIKKKTKTQSCSNGNLQKAVHERIFFFIFLLFSYFSDLRKSDRRISSGQTRKVLYSTKATRGNQKHGISPRIQVKNSEKS